MTRFFNTILIGISTGSIYSLMALALVLVWRSTRVINFAQAGQAILSTYIGYVVVTHTNNYWIAFPVALIFGALFAALVDALLIRTLVRRAGSGPAAAIAPVIATLGLLGIIRAGVGMIWGGDLRQYKLPVTNHGFTFGHTTIPFAPINLLIVGTTLVVMVVFSIIFQKTNLGLALLASAFQPEIARLSGIRVDLTRTIGWAFAGGAGAIAGVLVTPTNYLSPNSLDLLLDSGFVAAVIGGLESLIGSAVGGIILGVSLAFVLEYVSSSLAFPVAFVVLIIVLFVRPSGIMGKSAVRHG
jgi:branched-chain amino acid transport system permease protein